MFIYLFIHIIYILPKRGTERIKNKLFFQQDFSSTKFRSDDTVSLCHSRDYKISQVIEIGRSNRKRVARFSAREQARANTSSRQP